MNKEDLQIKQGKVETEVCDWVKSLGVEVIRNYMCTYDNRTIIPIFIPTKSVGIAINELGLHSEKYQKKNLHAKKRAIARIEDIRLIQLTDKQWKEKNEICKSIILESLGMSLKVDSQDCTIEYTKDSTDEITTFFDRSHIDGFTEGSDYILLRLKGEIVSGLIIGRSVKHDKEVLRYAIKNGTWVRGAFERLIREYRKSNDEPLFDYVNLSLYDMNTHSDNPNWFLKGYTDAGYFWTDGTNISPQDEEKTGYYRHYDCGFAVYENVE